MPIYFFTTPFLDNNPFIPSITPFSLKNGTPEKFKRSYKLIDDKTKDSNPDSNISVKCLSSPL